MTKSHTQMRTALLWVITQWVVVLYYRCFGTTYRSHLQRWTPENGTGTPEDGTDRLLRNVGKKLLLLASSHTQISGADGGSFNVQIMIHQRTAAQLCSLSGEHWLAYLVPIHGLRYASLAALNVICDENHIPVLRVVENGVNVEIVAMCSVVCICYIRWVNMLII